MFCQVGEVLAVAPGADGIYWS